ncbi:MAG: hypothetical protein ACFFBJ_10065 [Promethearchaeota archaeon]
MNSEGKTGSTDITWGEILAFFLVIPTLASAYYGSIILTIAFGFLVVAAAVASVGESIRQSLKIRE